MALQKRTIKIIAIVVVTLLIIAALLAILLGLLLRSADNVELEVWPRGANGNKEPLISYKIGDNSTFLPWVRGINDTLKEYHRAHDQHKQSFVKCGYKTGPPTDKVCDVDLHALYPCTAATNYYYGEGKLCVFLKLNKVRYWKPSVYNSTEKLPATMPLDLQLFLKTHSGQELMNEVWVSCEGKDETDRQNIGTLQYVQNHGFPNSYFPYNKQEAYLSPVVAVAFENPARNQVINVVCKAWAKNIVCEGCEQATVARFQVKVSD